MLSIKDKRALRKLLVSKVTLVVLFILFFFIARGTWGVYQKAATAEENYSRAEHQLHMLNERAVNLQESLDRIETPLGKEEELRHKFDMGHAGEHLIVLVDAPPADARPRTTQKGLWHTIKSFFGFSTD